MGIFNINSGFAKFVNRAVDVLLLNILWIVFSLPIVTIGASTCAAFYVTLKMVDEEEGYIVKSFVKAFKEDFKQGTVLWGFTAPCIYALYLIWQCIILGDANAIVIIGAIIFTAIVICTFLYSYPMVARYENSLKNIIKNSIGICLQNFGKTLLIVGLVALEVVIISWNKWTLLAGLLIGPEFIIYTISGISKRIFQKMEQYAKENGSASEKESAPVEEIETKSESVIENKISDTMESESSSDDNLE